MKFFKHKAFLALFTCLMISSTNMMAQDNTTWFVNPIIIPQLIDVNENNPLELRMDAIVHNFNPNRFGASNNTLVPTYAYNNANNPWLHTVLGPIIRWHYGDSIDFSVTNNLPVFSTTHWHGAHVPAYADGGPHQRINPGETWSHRIKVLDESATMWYHPHGMDVTYEHVQMGLSGMLYVDDPTGDNMVTSLDTILHELHDSLPTTYAVNDFPLIFQTKKFKYNADSSIVTILHQYDPTCKDAAGNRTKGGYKDDYDYVTNGRVDPFIQVPPSLVRLRLLNGDAKFAFNLGVGDRSFNPKGFYLIATDAGYTDKTYAMDEVLLAPGERAEILVDFNNFSHGDTLFIYNKVSDMPPGTIGDAATTGGYAKDRVVLKIIVNQFFNIPPNPLVLPRDLRPLEPIEMDQVSRTRVKTFSNDQFMVDSCQSGVMIPANLYNINGQLMEMPVINDTIMLDSTEVWVLDNQTKHPHPFHIHDIHFNVFEITDSLGNVFSRANPGPYTHIFMGPKDVVLVPQYSQVKFIATFDDFGSSIEAKNSYMYHCHLLSHEDRGMMGQFVVWDVTEHPTNSNEQELFTPEMTVFPNPTDGLLYLDGVSTSESVVRFFDIQGRLLSEQNLAPFDGTVELEVQNLPKGMLFLQWVTEEGRVTKKIIKQ